jgi:hypothetical protein
MPDHEFNPAIKDSYKQIKPKNAMKVKRNSFSPGHTFSIPINIKTNPYQFCKLEPI